VEVSRLPSRYLAGASRSLRMATFPLAMPHLRTPSADQRDPLTAVLEFELVGVAFQPIVHVPSASTHGYRALRVAPDVSLPDLPSLEPAKVRGLATTGERAAALERLWQKATFEATARHVPADSFVVAEVRAVAFDEAWTPAELGRRVRHHGRSPERTVLELDTTGETDVTRLTAELRLAGFRVAIRDVGTAWMAAHPHFLCFHSAGIVRGEDAAAQVAHLAAQAFARDARLLVDGVATTEVLELLLDAGAALACGPIFGAASRVPRPLDPAYALALRARASEHLVGFRDAS